MTETELKKLLASFKNAPELGGDFGEEEQSRVWAKICDDIGMDPSTKPRKYTVWEYLEYLQWEARRVFFQPVAAAGAMLGILLGGFVTTVSASASRPGDILYPVKLATERFQLSFTSSPEERIRLHASFAEQRFQEAVDITSGGSVRKKDDMRKAIAGLKGELDSVHSELATMETTDPKGAAALTAGLSRRADVLSTIAQQTAADASADAKEDAQAVKDTMKQAETQTVDALVRSFEAVPETVSVSDVSQSFQREYQQVTVRLSLSRSRLAALRIAAAGMDAAMAADVRAFIAETINAMQGFDRSLADAMNIMAAGGYRRAFAVVQEADAVLDAREPLIAQKEIDVSTYRSNEDVQP